MMMSVVITLVTLVLLPLSSARLVVTSEADLYLETGQLDTERQTCQPCLTILRIHRTQSMIGESSYCSCTILESCYNGLIPVECRYLGFHTLSINKRFRNLNKLL